MFRSNIRAPARVAAFGRVVTDPEDVVMDADDVDAGDDYIADLGAP